MAVIPQGSGGGGASEVDYGLYKAVVKHVSDFTRVTEQFGDEEPRERTVFYVTYEILSDMEGNDDWEGEELRARYTASMNKNATLLKVARAILNKPDLPENYPLDTDDLVGNRCLIEVGQGKARNDGGFWRNVTNVMAMPVSKGKKKQVEADEDDPFANVA